MKIVLLIILFIVIGIVALALGNYLGYKMQEKFDLADEEQRIKDKQLLMMLRYKLQELDKRKNYGEISKEKYERELGIIAEQVETLESKYYEYD